MSKSKKEREKERLRTKARAKKAASQTPSGYVIADGQIHSFMSVDKESLMLSGQEYWPLMYKGVTTDEEAEVLFREKMRDMMAEKPQEWFSRMEMLRRPDQIIVAGASARWVDQGMPIIKLGHKRAAALMTTSIPTSMLSEVRPPFHAFYIELPNDLLHIEKPESEDKVPIQGIMVHSVEHTGFTGPNATMPPGRYWRWLAVTGSHLTQWLFNRTIEYMVGVGDEEKEAGQRSWLHYGLPLGDYDKRLGVLIGRMIASLCLLMTLPNEFQESKSRHKVRGEKKARNGAPEFRLFTERKPIQVDMRPAIRAYLDGTKRHGGGGPPTVQFMVQGHWRWQPYGPGRAQRRRQWIEPFWKGPEGALIASGAYEVSEDGGGPTPQETSSS